MGQTLGRSKVWAWPYFMPAIMTLCSERGFGADSGYASRLTLHETRIRPASSPSGSA